MKIFTLIFIIGTSILFNTSYASTADNANNEVIETCKNCMQEIKTLKNRLLKIEKAKQEVVDDYEKLSLKFENLKQDIKNNNKYLLGAFDTSRKNSNEIINLLKSPPVENKGMSFEIYAGLALSAVSVVVTALGVIIAILAFWGFHNIKKSAIEAAKDASVESSGRKLEEAIIQGRFNNIINSAINYVAFKDVMSDDESEDDMDVEE
ncbi:hypothetical protein ABMA79_09610 [Halobacteriovorax sp. HFRX-2_2]|uniref:hypothetical protein n=1 Tax=unclassified Halobacteriovorax TaxID=2639665 RepID=UPI003720013C